MLNQANQTHTNSFQMKNKSCLINASSKMQRPQSTMADKHSQIFNTSNKRYQDFYNDELRSQKLDFMNASKKSKEDTESTEKGRPSQTIKPPSAFADQD